MTQPSHTERAAYQFAFDHLESTAPHILSAIEKDLESGLSPSRIGSIWKRTTSQEPMALMVELAARFIAEGQ
jgi:hypothetical protein